MKVLVTSSRTPFALDIVRKLADRGEVVYASDTYEAAPGSHSRLLAGHFTTASPQHDTPAFIADLERIVREHEVDVVVPAFEECFYLAAHHERLDPLVRVYTGRFDDLARLHDKSRFQELAAGLGLPTPQTVVARSDEELRAALERFPRWFARAAFSRGGVELLTNSGPLAGKVDPADVHPAPDSPWLVQEFVEGPMVCSYSTLHDGRVTAHCTYRAPRQWEHSTGIQFESVDGSESLEIVRRIGGELHHTGQLSFDFVATDDGLRLIECNPRATDGVLLLSAQQLTEGLLWPDADLAMVAPGEKVQLDFAVAGQLFADGLRKVPASIHDLLHVPDAGAGWHDAIPDLYSFLAFAHHARMGHRERRGVFEAMSDEIVWNGEPIAGATG